MIHFDEFQEIIDQHEDDTPVDITWRDLQWQVHDLLQAFTIEHNLWEDIAHGEKQVLEQLWWKHFKNNLVLRKADYKRPDEKIYPKTFSTDCGVNIRIFPDKKLGDYDFLFIQGQHASGIINGKRISLSKEQLVKLKED